MKQNGAGIFLARTLALILFISIWLFDFGPEKLRTLEKLAPGKLYKASRQNLLEK